MKRNTRKIIREKIIGICFIVVSCGFGYLFFKLIPIFIEWIHRYTLIDTFKFLFGSIGELALAAYCIFGIFIGLSLLLDLDKITQDDDSINNND